MELVPLFITAIYGQEVENLRCLSRLKIGLDCRGFSPGQIKEVIFELKDRPDKLNGLRENHKRLNRRFLVDEFCDAVC